MDASNDLAKWQASSHPDLARRRPDELFEPAFAKRYGQLHNDLWQRIVRLHGTIDTLEQLEHFPFEYLYAPHEMEFWRLVGQNFAEMAIVLLYGLVTDPGGDAHTIPRFKNEIERAIWLDERLLTLFRQTSQKRKLDQQAKSLEERVRNIRNHRIAHQLIERQTGRPKKELAGVSLQELREFFDAAHSLFATLSFGGAFATLAGDSMPGTVSGKPARTCLDRVLDAVIRDSYFVNRPEREQPWWPELRKRRAPEDLQIMNKLRKRVGLPEA